MVIAAAALIAGGVLVSWIGWLGKTDRLTLNAWAGVRTATTMQSDATWKAAHRAGSMWIISGGVVMTVTGAVMVAVDNDTVAATIALVGTAIMLAIVLTGGWLGQQAAKRVNEPPPGMEESSGER